MNFGGRINEGGTFLHISEPEGQFSAGKEDIASPEGFRLILGYVQKCYRFTKQKIPIKFHRKLHKNLDLEKLLKVGTKTKHQTDI